MATQKLSGSRVARVQPFEQRNAIARDAAGDMRGLTITMGAPAASVDAAMEAFDVIWKSGTQSRLSIHKEMDFYGTVNVVLNSMRTSGANGWVNLGGTLLVDALAIAMIVRVDD